MKIYAISDTHFGHEKLIEWGRPEDFTKRILRALQDHSGDILIHCGDFCIGKDEHWHEQFRIHTFGQYKKKILVRGNHDGKSDSWYYNHGWDFVCSSFAHTYYGKNIIFTHIPVLKTDKFAHNVHGHLHGNNHRAESHAELYDRNWHKDLAPEVHDYKPVLLEKLLTT